MITRFCLVIRGAGLQAFPSLIAHGNQTVEQLLPPNHLVQFVDIPILRLHALDFLGNFGHLFLKVIFESNDQGLTLDIRARCPAEDGSRHRDAALFDFDNVVDVAFKDGPANQRLPYDGGGAVDAKRLNDDMTWLAVEFARVGYSTASDRARSAFDPEDSHSASPSSLRTSPKTTRSTLVPTCDMTRQLEKRGS